MKKYFAAFIMTYNRADILKETITKLLDQTFPPEHILVIDNSDNQDSVNMINSIGDLRISSYHVGYNSGPAGAAKIGLSRLYEEGYQWIYWGDDDNPPDFVDSFEKLFELVRYEKTKIGVIGAVGQYFNRNTGNIDRVPDASLKVGKELEVDSIAGGMCMIVHSDVVKEGILPEPNLFFGFEELDFCLKIKMASYKLLVSNELFLRSRMKYGRLGFNPPVYSVKSIKNLRRQFYSTRNVLWILKRNKFYRAFLFQLLKAIIKSVYGFKYGTKYGVQNFKYLSSGIYQGVIKSIR